MMDFHEVANIFPLMEGESFSNLVEDIRAHGQHELILIDSQNRILDGRNRYRACLEIQKTLPDFPIRLERWNGVGDLVALVLSRNLHRRHLSESQRAMVAAKVANLENGSNQHTKEGSSIDLPSKPTPISQPAAAKLLNVGVASVKRARQVQSTGAPELIKAVESGSVAVSVAAKVASLPKAAQVEVVA